MGWNRAATEMSRGKTKYGANHSVRAVLLSCLSWVLKSGNRRQAYFFVGTV